MKLNPIMSAAAAAGLMMAGQAHAVKYYVATPTGTNDFPLTDAGANIDGVAGADIDMEVWMSGATAQDNMWTQVVPNFCVAGTAKVYKDVATFASITAQGSAHRAVFCQVDHTKVTGFPVKTYAVSGNNDPFVLFHKRSAGGSGQGVQPVADATPIAHMEVNAGNCTLVGATYVCTINSPGTTGNHVSDAGVSDVEPGLFVGVNVPSGYTNVTAQQVANMEIRSTAALVFGTPVSTNLRNALQVAQIANGSLPGTCVAGDETEACMPSLTKVQLATLFTGSMPKWTALRVNGTSLNVFPGVTAPASTLVNICRRVNGSGTQATTNANIMHVPCTPGAVPPTTTNNAVSGPVTTLNSGSGDVENCLELANDANKWAIGVQSLEKNAGNTRRYRFIKIDGVSPTKKNVADNKYFNYGENTMQWRRPTSTSVPVGPAAGTDLYQMLATVATEIGSPSILASADGTFNYSWGTSGYLALSKAGWPVSTPFNYANPVLTATHQPNAGVVDSCRVPVTLGNSEL